MVRKRSVVAVLAGLAVALAGLPVIAQAPPPPGYDPGQPLPGPYEARLDGLLATHDFEALNHALLADMTDQMMVVRALNWLKSKEIAFGGSTYIAYLYSALLWRASNGIPAPDNKGLRDNAAMQLVLARWLIQSEGFQCADTSAPGARLVNLDSGLGEIGKHFTALPKADRQKVTHVAFLVLASTFKKRENDVWLCMGGIDYYGKYFAKHPDEKGIETKVPGSVGKTYVLPGDPTILPDFVPYADWMAKRHGALDKIADQAGEKRLTDYADNPHRVR